MFHVDASAAAGGVAAGHEYHIGGKYILMRHHVALTWFTGCARARTTGSGRRVRCLPAPLTTCRWCRSARPPRRARPAGAAPEAVMCSYRDNDYRLVCMARPVFLDALARRTSGAAW